MGVPPGNRPAVPRDWSRGAPEWYAAGANTRGRSEGRPYYSRSLRSAQSRKRVPSFVIAVTPGREFMKYPSYEQLTLRQCNSASLLEKGKSDVFLCLHG